MFLSIDWFLLFDKILLYQKPEDYYSFIWFIIVWIIFAKIFYK